MDETPSRRSVLASLCVLLGSLPVLGGLFTALRAALAPARSDKPARLPLCRLDQVPADGIVEQAVSFTMRRGPAVESVGKVVFVTRDPASKEVIAMSGECTHLRCPVQKADDPKAPLHCPCHGGRFSRLGEVLDGPPKAPLRRLRVELPADGKGMIHLLEV
ncbi:MAG: Rieske (2Fe-2S) protein [Planctomycetes bacterium]|nr:Rieske (2Fe-2S) protein [Planctomycetota bacterium]